MTKYKITWVRSKRVDITTEKEIEASPQDIAEISKLAGFTYRVIP